MTLKHFYFTPGELKGGGIFLDPIDNTNTMFGRTRFVRNRGVTNGTVTLNTFPGGATFTDVDGSYLDYDHQTETIGNEITLGGTFRTPAVWSGDTGVQGRVLIAKEPIFTTTYHLGLIIDLTGSNGRLYVVTSSLISSRYVEAAILNLNTTYFVAATFDATTNNVTVYINDVSQAIVNGTMGTVTQPLGLLRQPIVVGGSNGGGSNTRRDWSGIIYNTFCFNRVLSGQEIMNLNARLNNKSMLATAHRATTANYVNYFDNLTGSYPLRNSTNATNTINSVKGTTALIKGDGSTASTYPTKLTTTTGYSFDGTSDYLDIPLSICNSADSGTIGMLVDFPDRLATTNHRFFASDDTGTTSYEWRTFLTGTTLRTTIPIGGGSTTNVDLTGVGSHELQMRKPFVIRWEKVGADTTVFIKYGDKTSTTTLAATTVYISNERWTIGAHRATGVFVKMNLYNLMVSNKALTRNQIEDWAFQAQKNIRIL